MFIEYVRRNNKNSLLEATYNLLSLLEVGVSHSSISKDLLHHPFYPSLPALSDALYLWNVPNVHLELPCGVDLNDIPTPGIIFLDEGGHRIFYVLNKVDDTYVSLIDSIFSKNILIKKNEFLEKWNKEVVIVEKLEESGEGNISTIKRKEFIQEKIWHVYIFLALFMIFSLSFLEKNGPMLTYVFIFKLIGFSAAILLIMKELNLENELINNICNFNNKNFSCDSVLKSPFAREFNFFTLPELGIMYFAGGLLGIIFLVLSGSRPDYFWLALISVIFGPFSIIALLYQYFVVKKWCILCVVVQVALIAESIFAINYLNGFEASNLDFASFLSVFISLIIPISMWILLRHSFFNSTRVDLLTEQLNWFKRSPTVFSNIIDSQKEHDISLFKHELSFGNGNKANNITAVINFRCLSCRKSIKELVFISNHSESTKINIRFDFVNRAEDNNEIGLRLFKLLIENEEQAKVALLDWFKINNKYEMDRWLYKYPMPAVYEIKSINDLMDAHKNWFKSIGVEYSPVYFLNGRVIPSIYYIEDIKLHVRN